MDWITSLGASKLAALVLLTSPFLISPSQIETPYFWWTARVEKATVKKGETGYQVLGSQSAIKVRFTLKNEESDRAVAIPADFRDSILLTLVHDEKLVSVSVVWEDDLQKQAASGEPVNDQMFTLARDERLSFSCTLTRINETQ